MQSVGSSTDGLATKVLWRMLMTGRALHKKYIDISTSCCPKPGQAKTQACVDLALTVDRARAPCRQG